MPPGYSLKPSGSVSPYRHIGFLSLMAGADFLTHACGGLDTYCSASYDKFIYDEEIVMNCQRILKGYEISEESILFDCINEVAHDGNYLTLSDDNMVDSLEYYRDETTVTACATRVPHANWISEGCESVTDRASRIWRRRVDEYVMPETTKDQLDALARYVPDDLLKVAC